MKTSPFDLDLNDPEFIKFMAGCPFRWQGDHGALQWLQELYDHGVAGDLEMPAPVIASLNPSSAPAGTDITLEIIGTDFSGGVEVDFGAQTGLEPTIILPTSVTVWIGAGSVPEAGIVPVSIVNGDGKLSNAIDFTVT